LWRALNGQGSRPIAPAACSRRALRASLEPIRGARRRWPARCTAQLFGSGWHWHGDLLSGAVALAALLPFVGIRTRLLARLGTSGRRGLGLAAVSGFDAGGAGA